MTPPVGTAFGRWIVQGAAPRSDNGQAMWLCRCACGIQRPVARRSLVRGSSRSCGCEQTDGKRRGPKATHGQTRTAEYTAWKMIKQRCLNPHSDLWAQYGGRGITMEPAWASSFETFRADVGPRPSPQHVLGRRKIAGNYDRGNTAWLTREQHRATIDQEKAPRIEAAAAWGWRGKVRSNKPLAPSKPAPRKKR